MEKRKENYRKFNFEKLVYYELPSHDEVKKEPEAAEKPADSPEAKAEKAKDRSAVIKTKRESATSKIDEMEKKMAEDYKKMPKYKEATKKVASALRSHAQKRFNEISEQYNKAREGEGIGFENSEKAKNLEDQARQLHKKIEGRLGKAKEYIKHQARQDRLEDSKDKPKEAKEREQEKVHTLIIKDYLLKAEATKKMSGPMTRMVAEFIIKSGLVNFEHADLDSADFKDDLDSYFSFADKYHEFIGKQLDKQVLKSVVDQFLEKMPDASAKKEEIDYIENFIKGKYPDNYGTKSGPNSHLSKAAKALATRWDIRFNKEGKPIYATDLLENRVRTYSAKDFEASLLDDLNPKKKPPLDVSNPDKVDDYAEAIEDDDNIEAIGIMRKEIRENVVGYVMGDKIDSWDDWGGHEAAEELMRINSKIEGKSKTIEQKQDAKEQQERNEAAKRRMETGFRNLLIDAGINKKRLENFEVKSSGPSFVNEKPAEMQLELKNKKTKDQMRITVTYDGSGNSTIRIHKVITWREKFKQLSYSQYDRKFSAEEFKKIDLESHVQTIHSNYMANYGKILRAQEAIDELGIKDLSVGPISEETQKLYDKGYQVPDGDIIYEGQQVGKITFEEGGKATIKVEGQPDKKIDLDKTKIKTSLTQLVPKMKEVAGRAEKNKEEIKKQVEKDKSEIKEHEGLSVNWKTDEAADYKNNEAKAKIATFNKTDKSLAASLSIKVGAPRKYILTVDGKDTEFDTMKAVNDHIAANRESLARIEEKPKPVEIRKDTGEAAKKAREKLGKIAQKLFGEKMAGINPEDPEFSNALTHFINGLTQERVKELSQVNVDSYELKPEEAAELQKSFVKAYGFDKLDNVDENEVKVLNEMEIDIKGETKKFGAVFGENLMKVLSMTLEIKKEGDKVMVKEGDKFVEATGEGLAKHVPDNLRENYLKLLNGKDVKDFDKEAGEALKTRQAMKDIKKAMKNPENKKEFKKMGTAEVIASLGMLWKMFQEAMATGDWQTLQDALMDFNQGRNPSERIKTAHETYSEKVNKINDTETLVDLYLNPYGDKAKGLFETDKGKVPYRIRLKTVVEERLEKELGIDITSMEKKGTGTIKMRANKWPKTYQIYLENSQDKTWATMEEMLTKDDGTEYASPKVGKSEINKLSTGEKSLGFVLFQQVGSEAEAKPEAKPGADKPADKSPEAAKQKVEGIKKEYFEMKDGKMLLTKAVAPKTIVNILEADVQEVTIKPKATGKEVTVKRSDGFKVAGRRIRIYQGDEIVSTKKKEQKKSTDDNPWSQGQS